VKGDCRMIFKVTKSQVSKIPGIFIISVLCTLFSVLSQEKDTGEYVKKGRDEVGKRNFEEAYRIFDECIGVFSEEADRLAATLSDFPPSSKRSLYQVMNDVAVCYFIKGEALTKQYIELMSRVEALKEKGKEKEAGAVLEEAGKIRDKGIEALSQVIKKYPHAEGWDPRGWFYSVREKAEKTLAKLIPSKSKDSRKEEVVISRITLSDPGGEFPVDYEKYGEFEGRGTENYKYLVKDQQGLSSACGEGIFPNTTSVRYDPGFIEVKKNLYKVDHWKVLNSRDLNLAFYKWNMCGEPGGVKQFYIGDLLERSGLLRHAVKAYYAVVVHYPRAYSLTYWRTPWYVGRAAISRINYLLREHPELGLELVGAEIKVINGFDHDISNDVFVVSPGKLAKKKFYKKLCIFKGRPRKLGKIKKTIGSKVKLVQYESGDWQLLVNEKPFVIKGVTYAPTRVGESPDEGNLADWMLQDTDENGIIDSPYESWVDKNKNNRRDADEKAVGDFQLMKDMGVNCIRVYKQPHKPDKAILRNLYKDYGIMVMMGDFLGKYAMGSRASWSEGTDYANPKHRENMLKSVKEMVEEHKDEPYVLMWVIGNENVYGVACNADKDPESFFKFADEAALMIKKLDPTRPVAIASGDVLFLDVFSKYSPNIDIFGTNSYRGKYGFGFMWKDVKRLADKPCMITEFGAPSIALGYTQEEAESFQAEYHRGCWFDMMRNSSGFGEGCVLGGIVFEWLDEWWKAYEPGYHDEQGLFTGPFLDGYMHEEWLGICGQGDGKSSPLLRQLKEAYFAYRELWSE